MEKGRTQRGRTWTASLIYAFVRRSSLVYFGLKNWTCTFMLLFLILPLLDCPSYIGEKEDKTQIKSQKKDTLEVDQMIISMLYTGHLKSGDAAIGVNERLANQTTMVGHHWYIPLSYSTAVSVCRVSTLDCPLTAYAPLLYPGMGTNNESKKRCSDY